MDSQSQQQQASNHQYEYRGMMAAAWDLLRGDTSSWPDRSFYRDLISKSGQPVLDVGCGTGRLLLDYLAAGIDIEGVDTSPEMLGVCRRKAKQQGLQPVLYHQAMETLKLPRRYRTILVPSSSFQLITDPAAATQAIANLIRHLVSGGVLVMSFMLVNAGAEQQEWHLSGEATRPDDGLLVRHWSRSRYDSDAQLEHTEDRYELLRDGEMFYEEYRSRSPATRGYTQIQVLHLYTDAGFTQVQLTRGFTWCAANAEDTLFCALGTRP